MARLEAGAAVMGRLEVAMRRWTLGLATAAVAAGLVACGGGDSPTGASGGGPVFTLSLSASPGRAASAARWGAAAPVAAPPTAVVLRAELAETGGRVGGRVAATTLSVQLLDGSRRGLPQASRERLDELFFSEGTVVGPGQRLVREGVVDGETPLIFEGGEQAVAAEIDRLLAEVTLQGDEGGQARVTAETALPCLPTDSALCLQNGRFRGLVEWRDFDGRTGLGTAAGETEESGHFWFFSPSRPEHTLEVLDRCRQNGAYWVRAISITPFETTLRLTDTRTGRTLEFTSARGSSNERFDDESAFATCP